ncbi:MAG TPA: 3-hydroxyacyl-ACP dehydratase FabZ [bacterium]|nr:3-hydroxyacyl-ACP dehydratase FabZ [bacterium]HPG34957.1 3-hydroxyacyl-ACP dehydratase FabZ [bacterium]HPM47114.1 3-hydroxyacyl-ACP dehydratase FabZ [bacterium]HQM85213.1 3-hydroxyacyl-ACP dehydratase FabZ [bacterium]
MLNSEQIKKILPHRYPFLMIDRAEVIEEGKKAAGCKMVSVNEPFFQGHFPQEAVMPGVLIVEAMAQLGAVAVLSMEQFKGKIAYFTGINNAKFRQKVVPGDKLDLEIEIVKMRHSVGIGAGKAFVNGILVCEAEISFAIG